MFFISGMEETIRTGQLAFLLTIFCRAFHGGSLKKIKILSFTFQEIFTKSTMFFFETPIVQKLISRFSQNEGSTNVALAKFDHSTT